MTIYALSTAPGRGGIAVIRISGRASRNALDALSHGRLPAPRMASFRRPRHPATAEVSMSRSSLAAGSSELHGQDSAELHVHGGRAVVGGRSGRARLAQG